MFPPGPYHPYLVHFVAFTILVSIIELAAASRRWQHWRAASFPLLVASVVAVAIAMWLGFSDIDDIELKGPSGDAILMHRNFGFVTGACYLVLLVLRFIERRKFGGTLPRGLRIPYLVLCALGLGLVSITGYLGGELVFRRGINVR